MEIGMELKMANGFWLGNNNISYSLLPVEKNKFVG
jgi:hypothetical protein